MSPTTDRSGMVLTGPLAAALAAGGLVAGHQLVTRIGTLDSDGLVTVMVVRRVSQAETLRGTKPFQRVMSTRIELVERAP